ncbi:hypothetical protein [uncultured Lutibacter sp.]|nr:hypothetical protein [uncultured Lutibacter sp.]
MILLEKIPAEKIKTKFERIYINTITPYFEFKNKDGRGVLPIKRCIRL